MLYFINPKERSRRMAKKKRRSPAQKAATRKMIAARKRKVAAKRKGKKRSRRAPVKRRIKRAASKRKRKVSGTMKSVRRHGKRVSRAAWKRSGYTRNKPRRRTMAGTSRKRSYRRNPAAFSVRGIMKSFQQGVVDAAGVVGGKAATRLLANMLPLPKGGALMGFAVQGVSALIVGTAARQFLGRDTARMMIAGGIAAPIETLAKGLPLIGPALGDDYLIGEYFDPSVGDLPVGEYYEPMGDLPIGEYVEVE